MAVENLDICGYFDAQRFPQFSPADAANWTLFSTEEGKKKVALYPTLGRKHVNFLGLNKLQFNAEPRAVYKSVDYFYVIVLNKIYRYDSNFNSLEITGSKLVNAVGNIYFTYLIAGSITFACFADGSSLYVYREDNNTFQKVTDSNAPPNPLYLAAFANRLVVSSFNSSTFYLSVINLAGGSFDPAACFTPAVFAQEDGIIGQLAVLHNTLYIFTTYSTGIWQNTPAIFSGSGTSFPFKKNTSISFDYGINDPLSLDVGYNMMVWEARNVQGLVQFMVSSGQAPENITSKAVSVLLQENANAIANNPLLFTQTFGFLYSYENRIFYRVSLGNFNNFGQLDIDTNSFSLEYNFDLGKWSRVIEANGERNRAQKSVYFNNRHLITVFGETTIYEMSGAYYVNELRNPDQASPQALDAYIAYPLRYERTTPIIFNEDYSEFQTDYVEIDFVFGDQDFVKSLSGFANTVYLTDEDGNFIVEEGHPDNDPVYIASEQGNYPTLSDSIYNSLFKPHVSLYYSDDGGINFHSADNREFSQLGIYQWRMRWYQLGASRNRVYKLIAVSPGPIVVLGGVQLRKRISGGAN